MKRMLSIILALMILSSGGVCACADFDGSVYQAEREKLLGSYQADVPLSEEEKAVDEMLTSMRKEADALYTENTGYGLIGSGNPLAAESDLFAFCRALPKGSDLHAHDNTHYHSDRYAAGYCD